MLTTVIIILREFLEAALLISILSAVHLKLLAYRNWIFAAIIFGVAGAFLYASALKGISAWCDGSGQEVVNGISLLSIGLFLGFQVVTTSLYYQSQKNGGQGHGAGRLVALTACAVLIIILAIAREGAEIFVYYSGVNSDKISSMVIGGIIGSGLGICIGVLVFVVLYQLPLKNLMVTTSVLLILISAGIMSEATQSFIQAGLIMTGEPLWDTSQLIAEQSVPGQLLYAIFAYEATPTREEILVWLISALTISSLLAWVHFRNQPVPGK